MHAQHGAAQVHLLVGMTHDTDPVPPGWETHPVSLEELALAYLREPDAAELPGPGPPPEGRILRGDDMTALTVPTHQEEDAEPASSAVATDGLGDLATAPDRAGWSGRLLGGLAVYLWSAGVKLHRAYAAVIACRPASSANCAIMASDFTSTYDHTATVVPALLQAVPALIGAFVGAPMLARELETGHSATPGLRASGGGDGRWPSSCPSQSS